MNNLEDLHAGKKKFSRVERLHFLQELEEELLRNLKRELFPAEVVSTSFVFIGLYVYKGSRWRN